MPRTEEEAAWTALLMFRTQMCRDNTTLADYERSQQLARMGYLVSEWQKAMIKHIGHTGHSLA
jgi:hypothetical protein